MSQLARAASVAPQVFRHIRQRHLLHHLNRLAHARTLSPAVCYFSDYEGINQFRDLYDKMAYASSIRNWEEVDEIYKNAKKENVLLTNKVHELGIAALAHLGEWNTALDELHYMWEHNINPSEISYDYVIDVLQVAEQPEKMLELLHSIKSRGETLSAMSYKTSFVCFAKARQWLLILAQFDEYTTKYRLPDVYMVNIALVASLETGEYEKGLQLIQKFPEISDNHTKIFASKLKEYKLK